MVLDQRSNSRRDAVVCELQFRPPRGPTWLAGNMLQGTTKLVQFFIYVILPLPQPKCGDGRQAKAKPGGGVHHHLQEIAPTHLTVFRRFVNSGLEGSTCYYIALRLLATGNDLPSVECILHTQTREANFKNSLGSFRAGKAACHVPISLIRTKYL